MKLPALIPGTFLQRHNRFRVTVIVDGGQAGAHLPNSGKLQDLLVPGRPVWLAPAPEGSARKTAYDLKLVALGETLVSVDARLPNPLFEEALRAGRIPGLSYPEFRREVRWGSSRLDFCLSGPAGRCWVETKSVTLVAGDTALFPDVPTVRGRRHLEALVEIARGGDRAAVVFIVQRPDARRFAPHREADPDFAAALVRARRAGVEVRAFTCRVTLNGLAIQREVEVHIDQGGAGASA